jgi:ATP phosphoribosyltransferase
MKNIRIAVQKSGRLSDDCLILLKECGIQVSMPEGSRELKIIDEQPGIEIILVRTANIPNLVAEGYCDIGIVGQNAYDEYNSIDSNGGPQDKGLTFLMKLGFSECRLSFSIPIMEEYKDIQDIAGKKIATVYPNILRLFLEKEKIRADIVSEMNGSLEIAPYLGVADLIFDIVESGNTLKANGMKEFCTIQKSEAVLIRNNKRLDDENEKRLTNLIQQIKNNKQLLKYQRIQNSQRRSLLFSGVCLSGLLCAGLAVAMRARVSP